MRKGQIFSTDLVVSLIAVVAFLGLVVLGFDAFLQDSSSTVDSVKMHQMAADAVAVAHYYNYDNALSTNEYSGLDSSAERLNYYFDPAARDAYQACTNATRGSEDRQVSAEVCR